VEDAEVGSLEELAENLLEREANKDNCEEAGSPLSSTLYTAETEARATDALGCTDRNESRFDELWSSTENVPVDDFEDVDR
jgi:hypothetical protein